MLPIAVEAAPVPSADVPRAIAFVFPAKASLPIAVELSLLACAFVPTAIALSPAATTFLAFVSLEPIATALFPVALTS